MHRGPSYFQVHHCTITWSLTFYNDLIWESVVSSCIEYTVSNSSEWLCGVIYVSRSYFCGIIKSVKSLARDVKVCGIIKSERWSQRNGQCKQQHLQSFRIWHFRSCKRHHYFPLNLNVTTVYFCKKWRSHQVILICFRPAGSTSIKWALSFHLQFLELVRTLGVGVSFKSVKLLREGYSCVTPFRKH